VINWARFAVSDRDPDGSRRRVLWQARFQRRASRGRSSDPMTQPVGMRRTAWTRVRFFASRASAARTYVIWRGSLVTMTTPGPCLRRPGNQAGEARCDSGTCPPLECQTGRARRMTLTGPSAFTCVNASSICALVIWYDRAKTATGATATAPSSGSVRWRNSLACPGLESLGEQVAKIGTAVVLGRDLAALAGLQIEMWQ